MKRMYCLLLLIFCAWPVSNVFAGFTDDLKEVNANFTYRSQPIHPGLVQEFSTLALDHTNPITVSVDVATGMGTNEYPDNNVSVNQAGVVCSQKNGTIFCYRWLGRLKNGIHVLNVGESGSGSWRHGELFFVRFEPGRGYTAEGRQYGRILMTVVRSYPLRDDFSGNVKIDGNKVIVREGEEDDAKDKALECPAQ